MKVRIGTRNYDTATATLICTGTERTKFRQGGEKSIKHALYKKRNGEYFLYDFGASWNWYGEHTHVWNDIRPCSEKAAMRAYAHLDYFPCPEEDERFETTFPGWYLMWDDVKVAWIPVQKIN